MIHNVHERAMAASADDVGALLETLASPQDRLWRTDLVEPMVLNDGLRPGSSGGHGPVRYRVIAHTPGRSVVFRFDPGIGLDGTHGFDVVAASGPAGPQRTVLRHTIEARPTGIGRLAWPTVIRHIHDAALEDILDNVERELTGEVRGGRSSAPGWVRWLGPRTRSRRVTAGSPEPSPLAALDRIDAEDRWCTTLLPGDCRDPAVWAGAVLGRKVPGASQLLALRDVLARPFGLQTMPRTLPPTGFPQLAAGDHEVVLGVDDKHLSFRVRITVDDTVSVDTSTQLHGRAGRAYWAVVRHFHPRVVRHMLKKVPMPLEAR